MFEVGAEEVMVDVEGGEVNPVGDEGTKDGSRRRV